MGQKVDDGALPEGFLEYFRAREEQRRDQVARMLGALTEREQRLVREAAVMGFVHGNMAERGAIPPDSHVVSRVLLGCDGNADLYPLLGGLDRAPDSGTDQAGTSEPDA